MKSSFLFGYSGGRKTYAQMEKDSSWNRLHPEFRRRVIALMNDCPHDLGFGTGFRSSATQRSLFLSRHTTSNTGRASQVYNGKRYYLKPGAAPTARPGLSFHEESDPQGFCFAVDFYNANPAIRWAINNAAKYGLKSFEHVNNEPWHFQPVELPNSRSQYDPNKHRLSTWTLPKGSPAPTPTPPPAPNPQPQPQPPVNTDKLTNIEAPPATLREGSTNQNDVRWLQTLMKEVGWHTGVIDASFGPQTKASVIKMQKALGTTADGVYGPQSRTKLIAWLNSSANRKGSAPAPTPVPTPTTKTVKITNIEAPPATLKQGVRNENDVRWLQTLMYEVGWHTGVIDASFGEQTKASVIKMQRAIGATPDGVYGPASRTRLIAWLNSSANTKQVPA